MGGAKLVLQHGGIADFVFEFLVAPAFFSSKVHTRLLDVLPLALARGVVH